MDRLRPVRYSQEYRDNMSKTIRQLRKERPFSKQHNERVRLANIGKVLSDDIKQKISQTLKDKVSREKHWNWKGGITKFRDRDNDSPEYKQWRKAVFKRDSYRCMICGNDKSGQLRAHHILEYRTYPLFRYDVNNGKTLCEDCHKDIHYGIKQQIQSKSK